MPDLFCCIGISVLICVVFRISTTISGSECVLDFCCFLFHLYCIVLSACSYNLNMSSRVGNDFFVTIHFSPGIGNMQFGLSI